MNEGGTGSLFTVYKRGGLNFSFYSAWMSVLSPFLWEYSRQGTYAGRNMLSNNKEMLEI